jgi:hypothetical protein
MRTLALPLALSLLLAACGGKVVVDDTEPPLPSCEDVCKKSIAACGGSVAECSSSCAQTEQLFTKICTDAWAAFLSCVNDNPAAQCQGTNACAAETNAITSCLTTECGTDPTACIP